MLHDQSDETVSHYTMMEQMLQEVEHHPYLGVEIANHMLWSHHVKNCTQKTRGILNFLEEVSANAQQGYSI